MLWAHWTDLVEYYTIRRGLVWNGAVWDFIQISPLYVDQIRPKPPKIVADKPMLWAYGTDLVERYTVRSGLAVNGAVWDFIQIRPP